MSERFTIGLKAGNGRMILRKTKVRALPDASEVEIRRMAMELSEEMKEDLYWFVWKALQKDDTGP